MIDFISGLVVLAIVLAFVTPRIRSIAARYRELAAGQPMSRSPRGLAESGGYRPVSPGRREQAGRFPSPERTSEETPSILRRPADTPIESVAPIATDARTVRRALATTESLRTAIILKEILDEPISMRGHGQ